MDDKCGNTTWIDFHERTLRHSRWSYEYVDYAATKSGIAGLGQQSHSRCPIDVRSSKALWRKDG